VKFSFDTADEISVSLWSKKAGQGFEVEENELLVEYDEGNRRQYTSEYERLVLDCIRGNQMMFVSTQEVAAMWKVIDPIIEAWQKNLVPLETYKPDTQPIS
jgi:glucose-6-phosphate 1-dehydrogenase